MADKKKKSPWAIEFGQMLRDRRLQLDLSQAEVSVASGVDRTLISNYESETGIERRPTADTLYRLAKALDVPEELMFEWAQVRYPSVTVSISKSAPPDVVEEMQKLTAVFQAGLAELSAQLGDLRSELDSLKNGSQPPRPRARRPARGDSGERKARS